VSVPVLAHKLAASLELQASSPRRTLLGHSTDASAVVNFTLLSQDVVKNLEASASIYNLFDTHYGDPGGPEHLQDVLPRDGRTFRVKLTYRF
jgi:iron complex outermembrane receptor protein